jgi:hypothetical protein
VFYVCPGCGAYTPEKRVDPAGPYAVCPECGYAQPFLRLPLFVITGASGAGKTAACLGVVGRLRGCVALETDILWGPEWDTPADGYRRYRATWLRLALNIGQSGRPVALFGTALPAQFEPLMERRYFAAIHYLALVCDAATLRARLEARPAWRGSGAPEFVARMVAFNDWLRRHAATTDPPMALYDSSGRSASETADAVAAWIESRPGVGGRGRIDQ